MTESKITIRLADWEKDKQILSAIRRRVFIEEQNVPEELEWDEYDVSAIHFLAFEEDRAIACARLKKNGRIGRMAVLATHRKKGTGKKLLQFILQKATALKLEQVYLHAQVAAVPFYEKQGFIAKGDPFYEANIPHQEMFAKLHYQNA